MKSLSVLTLVSAFLLPAGFAQPVPPARVPADMVLALVGGEKITAQRLRELLQGAPQNAINSARQSPSEFLTWTFLADRLSGEAVKRGLDKKSPYSDRIAWMRTQVLGLGRIEEKTRSFTPTDEQARAWFNANLHRFGKVSTRLIYVATPEGGEQAAQARLAEIDRQLKAGADFAELARKYSDDDMTAPKGGDFGTLAPDSPLPEEIRRKIYSTAKGKVTEAFRLPAGFYLFQVTETDVPAWEQAKDKVMETLRQARFDEWMKAEREAAPVKVENQEFFQTVPVLMGALGQGNLEGGDFKPDTVVAQVNGKPFTAGEFAGLLKGMPPQNRTNATAQPVAMLEQWAVLSRIAEAAARDGLDREQPYRNRLWYSRGQILMQAYVDEYMNDMVVSAEDQRAGYDRDPDRFRLATVRAVYIPYSLTPPPPTAPGADKILNETQARAKAEKVLKEIRAGLNFVQAVARYSEDQESKLKEGMLPEIGFADQRIPPEIKKEIFGAKEGALLGPIKLPNGFYLLKVESLRQKTYDEVKDQVYDEIRQQRFQAWLNEQRAQTQVEVLDQNAFRQVASE